MGSVPGIKSMVNSTSLSGGNPAISSGNCTSNFPSLCNFTSFLSHLMWLYGETANPYQESHRSPSIRTLLSLTTLSTINESPAGRETLILPSNGWVSI